MPKNDISRSEKYKLDVFQQHQLRIARQTLRMSDVGAQIMGGMTKEEARQFILAVTGKMPKESNVHP